MRIYHYTAKRENKNFPGTFCLLFFLLLAFFLVGIPATPSQSQKSPDSAGESELLTSVDEVFKEVSQIRNLEIKYPIRKGFKSQAELRAFVLKKLEEEYTDQEIAAETKAMIKLGLFPKDIQLKELLVNLLSEQVAGLYDPKEKIFYISNWIPGFLQKPIMAHELTHALQDQYFDLDRFLQRVKGNDDEVMAKTALIEGEALAVMIEYLLRPQGLDFSTLTDLIPRLKDQISILGGDLGGDSQLPEIIKESLLFPYLQGISFVQTFRKSHSWKDFSEIYADPPVSSEQILHPEKYFDVRDRPIPITLENFSDQLPKDWREIYTNVLGEFGISILVKKFAGEEMAKLAAEGWGGDRYKLLEDSNTGKLLLIHFSTWDSPKDAMEFFLAYRQVVENKYASPQLLRSEKRRFYQWSTGEGEVYLEVKGTDVIVIEGASEDLLPSIQKKLWDSRKG
jgi:hypothetical protein